MSWLSTLFVTVSFIAAGFSVPTWARAEEPQTSLAQLQYFVGEWHAEGMPAAIEPHALHSPQRDGIKLIVHPAMGGAWYAFSWLAYHAGQRSEGVTLMGYDASQGQFVQHDTTSAGAHGQALSVGWQGDSLVWHGTLHNWLGRSLNLRKTYQKVDDRHFVLTVEGSDDGQVWEALAQVNFAR